MNISEVPQDQSDSILNKYAECENLSDPDLYRAWEDENRGREARIKCLEMLYHEYGAIIRAWENNNSLQQNSVAEWRGKVKIWRELLRAHRNPSRKLDVIARMRRDADSPQNPPLQMSPGLKDLVPVDVDAAGLLGDLDGAWKDVNKALRKIMAVNCSHWQNIRAAHCPGYIHLTEPYSEGGHYSCVQNQIRAHKSVGIDGNFLDNLHQEARRVLKSDGIGKTLEERIKFMIDDHLRESLLGMVLFDIKWTYLNQNDFQGIGDWNISAFGDEVLRSFVEKDDQVRFKLRHALVDSRLHGLLGNETHLKMGFNMLLKLGKGTFEVYEAVCMHADVRLHDNLLIRAQSWQAQFHESQPIPVSDTMLAVSENSETSGVQELVLFGRPGQFSYSGKKYLGGGSFGIVYKATVNDSGNTRDIAVKVVSAMELHKETVRAKWKDYCRQFSTVLELQNPYVAKYHKVTATSEGNIEIIMDYYDGDLSAILRAKIKLSYGVTVCFAGQIAEGLRYLHDNHIIHGDLKPENILLQNGGQLYRLVIGDLDDSVVMRRMMTCPEDMEEMRGTMHYMAPEMLKKMIGQSEDDDMPGRKSDMWSFGCIVLDLVNCHTGIDKKWLIKGSQKIEAGTELPKLRFIQLIVDELFVPYVDDSTPAALAECIQGCLHIEEYARSSAEEVKRFLCEELLTWRNKFDLPRAKGREHGDNWNDFSDFDFCSMNFGKI
ncbi:uncharacterized protein LOC129588881 isoform X2 [Paramacrobiotus metropolitanus]|uniref:uncharacterized protein LOC129588881 isoform X2 n=1 Tax=Paramacrobiotus metropolitanus TaxID=2943436 RepID=UPI00244572BD|nr:uncharacterized protein LOC129588881 isoform X2 [Paramacrobiotus metropolitanus]